uniref:Putative ribonuclease H-like domain-containing protein n=1 Tax=Tanacetum cinerariifolium TaxID=118510 RepID=A0A6L2L3T0_TANCI|nr:putative ribonuclease H-like domain-containing protein [Tanacetum cinerariifolium]
MKTTKASGTEPSQEQQSEEPKELSKEEIKKMMELVPVEELYIKALQSLVKETCWIIEVTGEKEKELWFKLKRLYEPDSKDPLWALLSYMHDPLIVDNCKKGLGYENYNAVLLPGTGNFMPLTPYLSFTGLDEFVNNHVVENCKAKSSEKEPKVVRKNNDALIIEQWVSDNEKEDVSQPKIEKKTVRPIVNAVKGNNFNAVKASACWVWKPKHKVLDHVSKHNSATITLKSVIILMHMADQGVIDSGCSRHMTRNMSYLIDYKEIDGGYFAFGRNPKGRKITGKGTIKTGNLDFKNVYFVGELKFNLLSVSQIVPRKNNMFTVDLKNIVSKGGLTCLFAKATSDESKLWHISVARTPQQNRVAERRNRILIEAARTMLADSKLPTIFWAEAVNTACYVQNRVLVVKPHNKTPYKLFHGRTPALSFMRPFGCPITILNTIDHLGKFNGKADEGFFVGYSLNSKAFRVFNSKTRIVEENLHVRFNESTPNVVGSGLDWLFDIDALTRTMNYKPIVAGTQSNSFAGTKASDNADLKSSYDDGSKPLNDDGKKVDEDPRKENEFVNVAGTNEDNEIPFDPNMPALEDVSTFDFSSDDDDDDDGIVANMNNLDTTIQVSPILTTRIHKDHPCNQVIRDLQSATQTRKMSMNLEEHGFVSTIQQRTNHKDHQNFLFTCFSSQEEPKKVIHALKDPSWKEAMQEELLQFNDGNDKVIMWYQEPRFGLEILLVDFFVRGLRVYWWFLIGNQSIGLKSSFLCKLEDNRSSGLKITDLKFLEDNRSTGSESHPPMLNKENYVPWSSRLLRYAKGRPNGKLIHNSILNGPYVRRMIPEPGDANREVNLTETFHLQTDDELSDKELKQIEADDQAIQTILLGLPEDIYAAVDSCETAQEIWLRVQQMMKGSDIGIQEKKAKLFNEWERFTSNEGESIESYYHRFLKLMNDLKRNKHFPEKIASDLKFLNNLEKGEGDVQGEQDSNPAPRPPQPFTHTPLTIVPLFMRTHSSSNLPVESPPNPSTFNPKRRNRRRSKHPFILEESPVDRMADQRTMAELLRLPTEGYAEAIMVPSIRAE